MVNGIRVVQGLDTKQGEAMIAVEQEGPAGVQPRPPGRAWIGGGDAKTFNDAGRLSGAGRL
jgi:hypothetical protein